jgi:hypothetical protein
VKIERGLRLVDQRSDMADVDRLMQVHKLSGLAQPVEELAEILLHRAISWNAKRNSGSWAG